MKRFTLVVGLVFAGVIFSISCSRWTGTASTTPAISGPDSESAMPARDVSFEPTIIVAKAHPQAPANRT